MSTRILIVDDDPHIREVLQIALERGGYESAWAGSAQAALTQAASTPPDLIVLDIGLPGMDGLELCQHLRRKSDVPILFLSARADEVDRVLGLEFGADDYVTKPFSPRELLARIKVILKRTRPETSADLLRCGALELERNTQICRFGETQIALTSSELAILGKAMENPQALVTRQDLTRLLYGNNLNASPRTVDSHLRNLRRKLAEAGCSDALETRHGQGIRMGPCDG